MAGGSTVRGGAEACPTQQGRTIGVRPFAIRGGSALAQATASVLATGSIGRGAGGVAGLDDPVVGSVALPIRIP
jgi:hypothetical protein